MTALPYYLMRVLKSIFISLALISQITVHASFAPNFESTPILPTTYGVQYSEQEIKPIVIEMSEKYNVSFIRMMYTLKAESRLLNVQSSCHKTKQNSCGNTGVREESYGIAQFHVSTLPKEQALNPYIAIEQMAKLFSSGEACRWTEYRKKYGCQS